jgi:hypothetical protein
MMIIQHLPLFGFLLATLIAVTAGDELTCNTLRNLNKQLGSYYNDNQCNCRSAADTAIDFCSACIEALPGDSYKGTATSISAKSSEGPTYNQMTNVSHCFQYGSDMYGGANVCYETFMFGTGSLNSQSQCKVTIDGDSCFECQTFTFTELQFDCSNILYANSTGEMVEFEAVNNKATFATAIDGTLLRFMDRVQASNGCPAIRNGSGSRSGAVSATFVLLGSLGLGIFNILA